jgi:hypothetical protein
VTSRLRQTTLCALAAAVAVAGCGGAGDSDGRKLPPAVAEQLLTTVEDIQDRVDANVAGACEDIFNGAQGGNFDETGRLVASIPENVDPDIRSSLSESIDRLQELVSSECDEIQAREQEDQETVPEETVPGETVPEETETVHTETETTPTETETTPEPPPNDNGTGTGTGTGNGQGPDGTGPPGQEDPGGGLEVPEE